MNFDDFKYNVKKIPNDYGQKKVFFEELKNKFYKEIKKSKDHIEYFKDFNPDSVEHFMLQYATHKAHLSEYYKIIIDETFQNKELKYREETEKVFNLILQKKLWDLQLKWRANQIDLKEIRTTMDFYFWENNISACPFLPMVTEAEISIMKQYLTDPNHEDQTEDWLCGWQDYEEIMCKDEFDDLPAVPAWYEFYDSRMGTGVLLLLPNPRGEEEDYYKGIGMDYFYKLSKEKSQIPVKKYVPPKEHIHSSSEEMFKYAKTFENDKYIIELFRINDKLEKQHDSSIEISDFDIDVALDLLKEADTPVPMPAGSDWREAIIKCSQQYLNKIIAKELDVVYEEYKMFFEIGLSKNNVNEVLKKFENFELSLVTIRNILKGKELSGDLEGF